MLALIDASGEIIASGRRAITIFVDRPTCFACRRDGALSKMKEFLGLDELVILDSLGDVWPVP